MYSKLEVGNVDESTLSFAVGSSALGAPSGKAFGDMVLRIVEVLEAEGPGAATTDGKPIRWVVAHVHSSVPTVTFAAEVPSAAARQVLSRVMRDIVSVLSPGALEGVPGSAARSLSEFRRALIRHRAVVRLSCGDVRTELRGDDIATKVTERETHETGLLEGTLEFINIHEQRLCAIYDPVTGDRVQGRFGADLTSDVGRLIGHRVCATGEITYRDARAHSIKIEEIQDLTPSPIRSAEELRGIGRDWFGPGSSEDFVRGLWEDDD